MYFYCQVFVLTCHLISATALIVYEAGKTVLIYKHGNQARGRFSGFLKITQYNNVQVRRKTQDLMLYYRPAIIPPSCHPAWSILTMWTQYNQETSGDCSLYAKHNSKMEGRWNLSIQGETWLCCTWKCFIFRWSWFLIKFLSLAHFVILSKLYNMFNPPFLHSSEVGIHFTPQVY